jgi:heme A synthase
LGGGLLYACLRQGTWQQLLTYGAGNLLALTALILFRLLGKERIRKSAFLSMMYALAVQLLMQVGRALVAAVLGTDIGAALGYITTDILSTLLTVVIIWIARKPDGLFEDQKHYLLRLQSERQVEGRE